MLAFGVDGCPSGWFFVRNDQQSLTFGVVPALSQLIEIAPDGSQIFVDVPIGLRDTSPQSRRCDTDARRLLGHKRGSSVFSAPVRALLQESDYNETLAKSRELLGKGISKQAFAIIPKIREVDRLLGTDDRARPMVREVHPELCFWGLTGGRSMVHGKKSKAGFEERLAVLERRLPNVRKFVSDVLVSYRRRQVARDDIIDALVATIVASENGSHLRTLPANPERDSTGLPMEMVYVRD